MSKLYYYHYHPGETGDRNELWSEKVIPFDAGGTGFFSDRIYLARNSNARFYVVTFGYEQSWPEKHPKTIVINRYTMHFVFSGKGSLNRQPLSAGSICIVPPNEPYTIIRDEHDPLCFGWIALSGKELELMTSVLHLPMEYTEKISPERIEPIRQVFLETIYQPHDELPFYLFSRFFLVLSLSGIPYSTPDQEISPYIHHAHRFIDTHYSEPINVADIARELHISVSHLRSVFMNECGMSPQQAIIKKRISVAKALLQQEDPPTLQEIATACGYADQGAFAKRFRKETGIRPSAYYHAVRAKNEMP